MVSDRMAYAYELAHKCWNKAYSKSPEFVEKYLALAEQLLLSKPLVLGDEFREYCRANGLYRPATLHHNVWVSGVKALNSLGWIQPVGRVEPKQSHNHMPEVTVWKSVLFFEETPGKQYPSQKGLFD